MTKTFIISLGGSLINPGEVNTGFLKQFKKLVADRVKKGDRFIIISGGGKLCRDYNDALSKITKPSTDDLDWMGINITWTNAKLIQLMFGKLANKEITKNPEVKFDFKEKILVGGGWKPGRSSDGAAVKYATTYGAGTVINLSNIDYAYTKDPKKYHDAQPIKKTTWKEFRKIVGNKWTPGINTPFDPTAAKYAQENNLKVIIANGNNLKNLDRILSNKEFIGTEII